MTLLRIWALSSEMTMAKSIMHPWDVPGHQSTCPRPGAAGSYPVNCGLAAFLAFTLLALFLLLLGPTRPGLAAQPDPADSQVALPQGPLDFETCARLAIRQSPFLTKSSVEIDIRRLDENDSRYTVFPPPVTFRSMYYVDRPQQFGLNPKPYSLSFSMDPYNPFGSYFSLQAQKVLTQMAIFAHLKLINEGLERVGKMFLSLASMKRLAALQNDLVSLSQENLTFAENRLSIGTGTSLEVRLAKQELALAKSEKERLEITRKRTQNSLKNFLGLKPSQSVDFDLRDARHQVLGSFDPAAASLEQAKSRSYELKALELRKEMQGYNITVAKTKIFPNLLFTTQTPDPLSVTNARGLYVGLGLEVPVWDGLKRIRNVSRQKAILKQFGADKDVKEIDLTDKWTNAQEDIQSAGAALKIAQSQEELTRLRERQGEIRYQSGSEPLPTWLEARKANLQAQKTALSKAQELDDLTLNLRQISGDLGYSYVDQNSWQK